MESGRSLRLATFNMKHGAPVNGYWAEPKQVHEALKQFADVDILALQEVDKRVWRSKRADLVDLAANATGMEAYFAETMRFGSGLYGNALLVRGKIKDEEVITLEGDHRHHPKVGKRRLKIGYEPRNAIVATAHLAVGEIAVAATHLSTEQDVSHQQLTEVIGALASHSAPHVLLGDLNIPRTKLLDHPALADMDIVHGPMTHPADKPRQQIDHIAVQGLVIDGAESIELPISDHRALIVDARLAYPVVSF